MSYENIIKSVSESSWCCSTGSSLEHIFGRWCLILALSNRHLFAGWRQSIGPTLPVFTRPFFLCFHVFYLMVTALNILQLDCIVASSHGMGCRVLFRSLRARITLEVFLGLFSRRCHALALYSGYSGPLVVARHVLLPTLGSSSCLVLLSLQDTWW